MFNEQEQTNISSTGRWTHHEHLLFLDGLKIYGRNWKQISKHVKTRNGAQIRSHAQKYFDKFNKSQQGGENGEKMNERSNSWAQLTSAPEQETNINYSYFFSQIVKLVAETPVFNFWNEFIDISNDIPVEKQRNNLNKYKRSFVFFSNQADKKQPKHPKQEQQNQ